MVAVEYVGQPKTKITTKPNTTAKEYSTVELIYFFFIFCSPIFIATRLTRFELTKKDIELKRNLKETEFIL